MTTRFNSNNPFRARADGARPERPKREPWAPSAPQMAELRARVAQQATDDARIERLMQSLVALGQVVKELAGRVEQLEGRLADG